MDPLSIAVSSASLMTACTKLSGFIYTTITKVQNVDGTLQTLAIEINSLSQVLASLTTSLKDPLLARSVFSSQTKHEIQHWKNVKRCMDDCKDTLSTLEKMVKNCEKSGKTGGLFGSSKKFVSLSLNSEAISRSQVKIKSYTRTLQLSLQLITVCYAVNNDAINAELSAKVDAMSGHVQQVLNLLHSERSGLTSSSSSTSRNRDVGNLEVALQSTATLVTTAASIIETKSSQSGSRGTASIAGMPLTRDQRISIAEWIPQPISEEHLSMDMEDETPRTELSASVAQGDTVYYFHTDFNKCNKVTLVWNIKDVDYSLDPNNVARIELHTSGKPISLYLYRKVKGVNEQEHVATMRRSGLFGSKWTLVLPDSGLEILMQQGKFEYDRVHYCWHKDMKLQASNGKVVGSLIFDRTYLHDMRRALERLTLWNGVSNMTNIALITSVAAYVDYFGVKY